MEYASYNDSMPVFLWVAQHFDKLQIIILAVVIFTALLMVKNRGTSSQFKVREADRKDLDQLLKTKTDLANAKLAKKRPSAPPPPPLELPGIRLSGEPHEILGIGENADSSEIVRAYKEAIKRFHPDRIQGQAQEQLQFYQEAAAKLNQAKEAMLKKRR
jgi:DnaJ-domain-containing protein 1